MILEGAMTGISGWQKGHNSLVILVELHNQEYFIKATDLQKF